MKRGSNCVDFSCVSSVISAMFRRSFVRLFLSQPFLTINPNNTPLPFPRTLFKLFALRAFFFRVCCHFKTSLQECLRPLVSFSLILLSRAKACSGHTQTYLTKNIWTTGNPWLAAAKPTNVCTLNGGVLLFGSNSVHSKEMSVDWTMKLFKAAIPFLRHVLFFLLFSFSLVWVFVTAVST